jgi:hypothetical protein
MTQNNPLFFDGRREKMSSLSMLFDKLWEEYVQANPHAQSIHDLLADRGESIHNDHVAFRTFNDPRINVDVLSQAFLDFGYRRAGEYGFEEKKLNAQHLAPPEDGLPKVFISELRVQEFSPQLQQIVSKLLEQVDRTATREWDFSASGRPWNIAYADYEHLRRESEYAAWLSAFGFLANHFTVDVGQMKTFASLEQFNEFIKDSGYPLNTSGGEIKGSPAEYLEQSSTLAGEIEVVFSDGTHAIPACYYEFARRYIQADGRRFEGFIAKSADKIFESTDRQGIES